MFLFPAFEQDNRVWGCSEESPVWCEARQWHCGVCLWDQHSSAWVSSSLKHTNRWDLNCCWAAGLHFKQIERLVNALFLAFTKHRILNLFSKTCLCSAAFWEDTPWQWCWKEEVRTCSGTRMSSCTWPKIWACDCYRRSTQAVACLIQEWETHTHIRIHTRGREGSSCIVSFLARRLVFRYNLNSLNPFCTRM